MSLRPESRPACLTLVPFHIVKLGKILRNRICGKNIDNTIGYNFRSIVENKMQVLSASSGHFYGLVDAVGIWNGTLAGFS